MYLTPVSSDNNQSARLPNAILELLASQRPEERSHRYTTVVPRYKHFPIEAFIAAIFTHNENGKAVVTAFVGNDDSMSSRAPTAAMFDNVSTPSEYRFREWIYVQYPQFRELVQQWRDSAESGYKDMGMSRDEAEKFIRPWIVEYKKQYGDSIGLLPYPHLYNRIGVYNESLHYKHPDRGSFLKITTAAREVTLETILGLVHSSRTADSLDAIKETLQHKLLVGDPSNITPEQVSNVLSWVFTQFPELAELQDPAQAGRPQSELKERYGSHFAIIPLRGATADWDIVGRISRPTLNAQWILQELPLVVDIIRHGTQTPPPFREFRIPVEGRPDTRDIPRKGDRLKLFIVYDADRDGRQFTYHSFYGTVEAVILDAEDRAIGMKMRRVIRAINPKTETDQITNPEIHWFADLDLNNSRIEEREIQADLFDSGTIPLSSVVLPENTGEFTLRVGGKSNLQTPVSIGDSVVLSYQGVTSYSNGNPTRITISGEVTRIYRDEDGMPTAIEVTQEHAPSYGVPREIRLDLWQIDRTDTGLTRIKIYTNPNSIEYRPIGSPVRMTFDNIRYWLPKHAPVAPVDNGDSGEFMLPIPGTNEMVPLTRGDEVLLQLKGEGLHLERILIMGFIRDSKGIPIGLRGNVVRGRDEVTIQFADIEIMKSYFDPSPWSGDEANRIPGAYDRRRPIPQNLYEQARARAAEAEKKLHEFFNEYFSDFFEDYLDEDVGAESTHAASTAAVVPWTKSPISLEQWLRNNGLNKNNNNIQRWARWVLVIDAHASEADIKNAHKALARRFHPDREGGSEEAMKVLNLAREVLVGR